MHLGLSRYTISRSRKTVDRKPFYHEGDTVRDSFLGYRKLIIFIKTFSFESNLFGTRKFSVAKNRIK